MDQIERKRRHERMQRGEALEKDRADWPNQFDALGGVPIEGPRMPAFLVAYEYQGSSPTMNEFREKARSGSWAPTQGEAIRILRLAHKLGIDVPWSADANA